MDYTPQELALAIRKLIENHPENWQQAVWYGCDSHGFAVDSILGSLERGTCGTVACVAGWAAILTSPKGTVLAASPFANNLDSVSYPDGSFRSIQMVAQEGLNLDDEQANWLFSADRTQNEVVSYLTRIENDLL